MRTQNELIKNFEIVKNVSEVYWEVYFIKIIWVLQGIQRRLEVIENLPHASGVSTSVNDDNIEMLKKCCLKIVVMLASERYQGISHESTYHILVGWKSETFVYNIQ